MPLPHHCVGGQGLHENKHYRDALPQGHTRSGNLKQTRFRHLQQQHVQQGLPMPRAGGEIALGWRAHVACCPRLRQRQSLERMHTLKLWEA